MKISFDAISSFASNRCMQALPKSVLLIDDEAHVRMYVRLILQQLGVNNILEAPNCEAGLEIFKTELPEVVLLDINMPGMTGLELLPKITRMYPETAVIMLTGQASRQLVETAEHGGAVFYIRKDLDRTEIARLLEDLFRQLFGEEDE